MKKRNFLAVSLFFALFLPLATAFAVSHEHQGMDHGTMNKMDHGARGGMAMLGDVTLEGVKAMAHLNDVGAAMKKAGLDATHHLMVAFADAKTGKQITEGSVAAKITGPDGKAGGPVKLVGMEGHFGADIALKQKGDYTFEVGSKLPDGKVRQFEFKHTLK